MGTISSGIGLISGINTDQVISQLIAIEARPRQQVEERVTILQSQKTAFLDINAKLLAMKLSSSAFLQTASFGAKKATSSNTSVLTASAGSSAALGTYHFTVSRLVSTQQLITRGLADADTTTMGTATTLRIESAAARLDRDTELADLNGFAGVQRGSIRITDRSGNYADIDLSRAVTVNDVITEINNAANANVTASIDGDRLVITDNTGAVTSNLIVSNLGSTQTATSLGIAGNVAANTLTGTQINRIIATTPLSAINDGLGVRVLGGVPTPQDDFEIDDGTSTFNVALGDAQTIQDVLDSINDAVGNTTVTASIAADGVSLQLAGAGGLTVTALGGSNAAADLGIINASGATYDGERILAAINSKLIRNLSGAAATAGTVGFTTDAFGGVQQDVNLSTARSFSDVVNLINDAGAGVTASLNQAGNGVKITSDDGTELTITDVSGDLAASLGLDGVHTDGEADGGDVDYGYLSENTRLDSLNGGKGVKAGKFIITDSSGASATVDLTQGETTLAEVIAEINSRPIDVTAAINATGDGILLTDTAGGALQLTVEESGSTTAKDLGILGEAEDGDTFINGSFEKTVDIEADDTLEDVADKLNAASVGLSATIINDGSSSNPYRLNLTSSRSGRDGRMLFDDGGLGFDTQTLVEGRDAVAFFGSSNPAEAVLLTSSTNSLTNTISGVSIDLAGTSTEAVELTISQDSEQVVTAVKKFVDDFNSVMTRISQLDRYDTETKQRGLLLGDPALAAIRRQLLNTVTQEYDDVTGQYTRLTRVGVTIGGDSKLNFNEAKFREALSTDLTAVTELFNLKTSVTGQSQEILPGVTIPGSGPTVTAKGVGATFEELLKGFTDSITGTLTRTTTGIDDQIELANDRIEQLNFLLAAKRQRLEQQFAAMEAALARIQSQQNSLLSLSQLAVQIGGR